VRTSNLSQKLSIVNFTGNDFFTFRITAELDVVPSDEFRAPLASYPMDIRSNLPDVKAARA
jgi:hypothetical protein